MSTTNARLPKVWLRKLACFWARSAVLSRALRRGSGCPASRLPPDPKLDEPTGLTFFPKTQPYRERATRYNEPVSVERAIIQGGRFVTCEKPRVAFDKVRIGGSQEINLAAGNP